MLAETAKGLTVAVRLTPGAGRDRILGLIEDGAVLKVAVTAPPEDGKANAALIKLLAKAWRLPGSSLSVIRGATARRKTLLIEGDAADLRQHLEDWKKNL